MKSRIVIVVLGTILSLLNVGCEEVIAKKISSETPVLIVPSVNDTVQFNPVQFKWEKMDGATEYRLQVVTPGFSNISYFTLDTIVTGTEFYAALDSAQYELKLTALNAGYESQTLGPIPFWVGIQPSGGSGTSVVLSTPLSGEYKQDGYSGPFSWNALTMATSYEFSLRQGSSFATGTPVHFQNGISTTNLSLPSSVNLQEGEYTWGVKAYFANMTETSYSTRTLYIDSTDPNTPAGNMLPSGSFESATVVFSWSNGTDVGIIKSPVTSVLQIASDSGFSSIWEEESVQGSTISVDMSTATPGVYYWRVYNIDGAGHVSSYSVTNQFILN
jgi:hypothetical protein